MAESIAQLRIYTQARELEDQVYQLAKSLGPERSYPLADDLRRSSAAVCHYISEAHHHYAYTTKLTELSQARQAAELTQQLLGRAKPYGATDEMIQAYTGIVKQCWGLIRYLKNRQTERNAQAAIRAADELVAARG